jgi:parallel beta-helix repeat protein
LATKETVMMNKGLRLIVGFSAAFTLFIGVTAVAAAASPSPGGFSPGPQSTLYVAPGAAASPTPTVSNGIAGFGSGHGFGCSSAEFSTISAAVAAANPGATIIVCPGTYTEDVTIEKPLTIVGSAATVAPTSSDSSPLSPLTGGNNGFTVLSPDVTVSGFTVEGASSDGLAVLGDHATIRNNTVLDNGNGDPNNPGNGIDLDGSSYSTVSGNTVSGSGNGGIQLANDPDAIGLSTICSTLGISCSGITGTATYDSVIGNNVNNNPNACGILLVDHAGTDSSTPNLAGGIHNDVVEGNQVLNNALQGYGAGILLATEAPGGAVYNNLVSGNNVAGNGLAGLTLHSHMGANQDLNGNVIIANNFGTNNTKDEEPSDLQTTGVFIGSEQHLDITVFFNVIHNDYYGVYTASPDGVTVNGLAANAYVHDTVPWFASNSYTG